MGKHRRRNQVQIKNTVMQRTAIISLTVVFLLSVGASAQEKGSEVSVQGTGIFTKDVSGQVVSQHVTQTGGALGGYRCHINSWLSAEAVSRWNRNRQLFITTRVV